MKQYLIKSVEKSFFYFILFFISTCIVSCNLDEIPPERISTFKKKVDGGIGLWASSVVELADKGEYIIVGQGNSQTSSCPDGYIAKISSTGDVLVQSVFDSPDFAQVENSSSVDVFLGVDIASDGDVVAVGWSIESEVNSCGWKEDANGGSDGRIFFVKVSPSLSTFDAEAYTYSNVGYASSWDAGYGLTQIGGTFYITGSWGVQPALLKVNSKDVSTAREEYRIDEDKIGEAKAAFLDSFGNIIFTGKVSGTNGTSVWETQALFAKLSPDGSITTDYSKHALKQNAEGFSIIEKEGGGYMLVGLAWETTPGKPDARSGLRLSPDVSLYICNYDANGTFVSNNIWEIGAISGALDIAKFEDGFIITGFIEENNNRRLLIRKVDADGNEEWYKTYEINENTNSTGQAVIATSDGGILAVGNTEDSDDVKDAFLVKTNREGLIFEE